MQNKRSLTTRILAVILAVITACSVLVSATAAVQWPGISNSKPLKTYTISTGNNTTAYTSTGLSSKKGTIYAGDELHIYKVGKNSKGVYYAYCSYPISSGRKYAYIPLSVVTKATAPQDRITAKTTATTYRRASTAYKAGSISKNDYVYKMTTSGSYTQVIYNVGSASNPSAWKLAWVTTSDYNRLKGTNTPTPTPTSKLQYPMKNMYCTWRTPGSNMSWGAYDNRSGNRDYHVGLDVYGTGGKVYAIGNGKVVAASSSTSGANGRYIIVQHTISGKTVYAFYAHLASVKVRKGDTVTAGKEIAVAGGSGFGKNNAYGKHLHFALVDTLWSNGSYYGYVPYFTGNKVSYGNVTFYNPYYVIRNNRLP